MTESIGLLQQLGLNKYEADAYYTLLAEGPLTGYELGKRSQVPLSRSYEILERLTTKGLALQQPGEPPRYAAIDHSQVLDRLRRSFTGTLDALAALLAALPAHDLSGEFWVVRGREHILARLRGIIADARRAVDVHLPAAYRGAIAGAPPPVHLRILHPAPRGTEIVLALADDRLALAGTLDPADRCQAVVGANPALLALLRGHFDALSPAPARPSDASAGAGDAPDWLEWEMRKQRRLWRGSTQPRSA